MLRKRTAPDASPEAVKQMTETRRDRSPPAKRPLPPLRVSSKLHAKSRGAKMVEMAKKTKEAQKSPLQKAKAPLPLIPSTPYKRRDSRPTQLIQYGKEKPDNNVEALFKRRKEQQQSISGFRGMENLGNTCYMNAVLQILTSLDSFATDMQSKQLLDASLPEDGVYRALLQVTKEKRLTGTNRGINPVALKRSVAKNSARFEGARQQDAHEFLCNLLDQVQEEVFHHYEKKQLPQDTSKLQLQDTRCPTSLNFSCIVEHELVCDQCGESSEVRELFRHLSLDIPERKNGEPLVPPNLQELLALYFKDEPLEKTCEKCGCLTCTVKHRVRRLPRVLVLHMKRFCVRIDGPVHRYVKRQDPVRIDQVLDLGPVCGPLTKGPILFGDQARPSPSHNKPSTTPLSPRRTLADVSNTWQATGGESPARLAKRESVSTASGIPQLPGRIRGGCSVVSDGTSDNRSDGGMDSWQGEECESASTEQSAGSVDIARGELREADTVEALAGAQDSASSVELDRRRILCEHTHVEGIEHTHVEPQRLRGGGAEPDSDPYALDITASEALEETMRDRADEMEGVTSGRIAERERVSTEDPGTKRKAESIYTRASPYENNNLYNPYEAFKNLPPGARFGAQSAAKVRTGATPAGVETNRGGQPSAMIRKPGQKISTVKNLFKSAGEKRAEEQAMLFSPRRQRQRTSGGSSERNAGTTERNVPVVDLDGDEDAELARVLAESEREFAAQTGAEEVATSAADVSREREQEQLDRAIALSLAEAAAAIQQEDLATPVPTDRPAPASPTVEIADDAVSGPEPFEPFSTAYQLHGIISHLGTLASSGHFIADVYDNVTEQWVRHDDSVVSVVSRSTVLNERREVDGYMFFYVHEPLVKQQKMKIRQVKESSKQNLEGKF